MNAARALARTMLGAALSDVDHAPNHEPSFWLRGRLVDLETRHQTRQLVTCGHQSPRNGLPWIVALWEPGKAFCVVCASAALALTGDADDTCDRCAAVVRPITLCTVVGSRVIVVLGLCSPCRVKEVGA